MGGVDLADMKRLPCNSIIVGQNRWWLKIIFYLLDVATSTTLVLYKKATKRRMKNVNCGFQKTACPELCWKQDQCDTCHLSEMCCVSVHIVLL
jgi:hypothetical protein